MVGFFRLLPFLSGRNFLFFGFLLSYQFFQSTPLLLSSLLRNSAVKFVSILTVLVTLAFWSIFLRP